MFQVSGNFSTVSSKEYKNIYANFALQNEIPTKQRTYF